MFDALFEDNKEKLVETLVKSRFYYVFEYTRSNGISIHSNNYLLPGEMTDYWYPFSEDEHEIAYTPMNSTFSSELKNYIYQKYDEHPSLDFIFSMAEWVRLSDKQEDMTLSWQEENIKPWDEALAIAESIITNNQIEQKKFTHSNLWRDDFKNLIQRDKTLYVQLTYMASIQRIFIEKINLYFSHGVMLQAITDEQYLASAKIEAIRNQYNSTTQFLNEYDLLIEYQRRADSGDLDLMIEAAVFWFLSRHNKKNDKTLSVLNILYVLQKFVEAQQYFFVKYKFRQQSDFTSVFELVSSDKKESLEDYYQQFYEYKLQHSLYEAQKMASHAINNATVSYLDAIYPPREIYSFAIFSRNYVANSLSPFNYKTLPEENLGYLSIARLHSGKLVLVSTLAGFVFIADLNSVENNPFLQTLKDYWLTSDASVDYAKRTSLKVNETTLASVFPTIDANGTPLTTLMEILLKAPEEDAVTLPQSPYSMVAIKERDIFPRIRPYLF
ncbi:hypothetical protein ABK905_14505 [Acerihabitans sp. KWT182]|uniref:Uncharacterized protein n=1 Tax=Acerihabitans sp. KWT182 TaxID=3157919 RepID=A0AAU7Q4J6_9GAMM